MGILKRTGECCGCEEGLAGRIPVAGFSLGTTQGEENFATNWLVRAVGVIEQL
jgi:hypothetical protein